MGSRIVVAPDAGGAASAAHRGAVSLLRSLLSSQPTVRAMFAAAVSQEEFLARLRTEPGIAWRRIRTFQLDEYVGLPAGHKASFTEWLRCRLFDHVRPERVNELHPDTIDPEAECASYAALLCEAPVDVAFVGVGENGHLAFNDPGVADFDDPQVVRVVPLDSTSRRQQVHDGAFACIENVPTHAMTVTIPAIMRARHVALLATGPRKAEALAAALEGPISVSCPASVLRRHPDVAVYIDAEAASQCSRGLK
jgi:glucosamine-6-phosphate deaminase